MIKQSNIAFSSLTFFEETRLKKTKKQKTKWLTGNPKMAEKNMFEILKSQ